ncbi:carboxypeptidase-like protein [Mucilaginibacter frigoritolerans]|uniref:Carboxypeptidase-like protein n=1 Tax=Mucilaginibacter frigoritolerans TaxID=652788 RepID=A0A562TT93_9SPHI|nr:carboxypeptidase-like regulatory domain-containing protein [Mucilaginibacter frigoritolerans]TWI96821.1 carboxypeptidase-like protein [Mucilaginibacter frigoritolerans]
MYHKLILSMCVLLLSVSAIFAQNKVSGKVTDEKGTPLAGVTITVKGSNVGTQTDQKGNFTIAAKKNDVLRVNYIGLTATDYVVSSANIIIKLVAANYTAELNQAMYLKLVSSQLQALKKIPAYTNNSNKAFSSDPTNPSHNAVEGLAPINELHITPEDSDGDGLSDADELKIGTDPHNPDTDGDGLLDGWEVGTINGINLKSLGASPLHKDIFVQMDYMTRASATNGLGPNPNVIAGIEKAFSDAPVDNPDGIKGITIHLILGQQILYQEELNPLDDAFAAIKQRYFNPLRGAVFHYMVWANNYSPDQSSGNALGIGTSDFVVTLGDWNNKDGGTDDEKIGTFIHELGHNLGLRHGGEEDTNYKPNHVSVMNYAYQITGINYQGNYFFSYQPFDLPALDESHLSETKGINAGSTLQGYNLILINPGGNLNDPIPGNGSIDFNQDGQIETGTISADINHDFYIGILAATQNEWARLQYKCGSIGQSIVVAGLTQKLAKSYHSDQLKELTEKMAKSH